MHSPDTVSNSPTDSAPEVRGGNRSVCSLFVDFVYDLCLSTAGSEILTEATAAAVAMSLSWKVYTASADAELLNDYSLNCILIKEPGSLWHAVSRFAYFFLDHIFRIVQMVMEASACTLLLTPFSS